LPEGDGYGERLLTLAVEAAADGVDPEADLRRALGEWVTRLRAAERST
jgi:hypothetical protein